MMRPPVSACPSNEAAQAGSGTRAQQAVYPVEPACIHRHSTMHSTLACKADTWTGAQVPVQTVVAGQQATLAIHSCRAGVPASPQGSSPGSPLDPREWDCSHPSSPVGALEGRGQVESRTEADAAGPLGAGDAQAPHRSAAGSGVTNHSPACITPLARQAWGYREPLPASALASSGQQPASHGPMPSSSPGEPKAREQGDSRLDEPRSVPAGSVTAVHEQLGGVFGEGAAAPRLQDPLGQAMLQQLGDTAFQEQRPSQGTGCSWPRLRAADGTATEKHCRVQAR